MLVNGLGLGNSTRCHAIIQELRAEQARIAVVTSGNGLWYFEDCPDVDEVFAFEALYYGQKDGKVSIVETLRAAGSFIGIMRRNAKILTKLIQSFRPQLAVIDSVYTVGPLRRAGIPVVGINNADGVVKSMPRFTNAPASIKSQFYIIEMADYFFHRRMADLIISPTLDPDVPTAAEKFRRVGPIVRKQCPVRPSGGAPKKVVIMLSGSTFGTVVKLDAPSYPVRIEVIGRTAPDGHENRSDVIYHGKIKDSINVLADADLVVVNGGFSAVSEIFYMRKAVVVVPVPRHAEQWINARTIEHLGIGLMADEEHLEKVMLDAIDRIPEFMANYEKIPVGNNGSVEAARLILDLLQK